MKRLLQPKDDNSHPKRHSVSPKPGLESNDGVERQREPPSITTSRSVSRNSNISFSEHQKECRNAGEKCYGSLLDLCVQVRQDLSLSLGRTPLSDNTNGFIVLEHVLTGDFCWLKLRNGEAFGCFNRKTSQNLKRLSNFPCIEMDCIVPVSRIETARTHWKKFGNSTKLMVNFNVYGHEHAAQKVGDALANARMFLQVPLFDGRNSTYENPQDLKLPDVAHIELNDPTTIALQATHQESKEVSRTEIESLLDHIPQSNLLRGVFTSHRVITPLMKHQSEAVDFITRTETGDLPPSLTLWKPHVSPSGFFCYKHVITGAKSSEIEDVTGGILADDMGLGKTLSMLAAIVVSLDRALEYAFTSTRAPTVQWQDNTPSKGTLIIVPSALLLDSWIDEIEKHIVPGTLLVHRYHGLGKTIGLIQLLQQDIVLTTYASIAGDFCRGRSILHRLDWYRVVLDEAHFIRNPATKQFRAIHAIPSKVRWCMTGTPIQNSLEDLGALVKFIKVPVLEDLAIFRKQITVPVVANVLGRFANLRRLLEALCLRRTKALLDLPEPITDTQILNLSPEETTQYHDFGEFCKHSIDLAISGHSMKKANQHVIQAILGMRLFCNDGEHALVRRMNAHGLPSDPEEALSYLQTSAKSTCVQCGTDIMTMYQEDDSSSGRLTICQHLICGECLPAYEDDLNSSQEEGRTQCPLCGLRGESSTFVLRPGAVDDEHALVPNGRYPTKLLALLNNVKHQSTNDKCVIFSFWKTTLDIVAKMLDAQAMPYCRIHGQIPASKRNKILSNFEKLDEVRILLITLGTGAVGLNKLKVANHIHILEPQWNPSVESQAIGRILRLGQEKSVKIVRYIMKNTVEEAVQSRQLRKLQLARGGFGLVKDEHTSRRVEEIMSLLCPSSTEKGQLTVLD